jgi:hypothetical protein
MRVRRDISAIPLRSGTETWEEIVKLITGSDSKDTSQLGAATGVLATIIADEHPAQRPIILEGVGAQLRLYCAYGFAAVEAGTGVDPLQWNPTAGNWTMHVPCDAENLSWVKASLAKSSPRIKAFDVEEEERADEDQGERAALVVDWHIKD